MLSKNLLRIEHDTATFQYLPSGHFHLSEKGNHSLVVVHFADADVHLLLAGLVKGKQEQNYQMTQVLPAEEQYVRKMHLRVFKEIF